ncbi:MAG: sigma-54-dependent transcriptional regulator [Vicinamibacterales bacterium]
MTPARTPSASALLIADRGEQPHLAALLQDMGYAPIARQVLDATTLPADLALCVIDLRQNGEALRTARALRAQHPRTLLIGVADPSRPSAAADAIRAGVFDVLPRPASARDLEALLSNAREQAALAATANGGPTSSLAHASVSRTVRGGAPYGIVGSSPAMRAVMELVQRAAPGRCGILVCGERGTGREMIARAIHAHDPSADSPFVKVDCSGPTPEEIELELFGSTNRKASSVLPERRSLERVGRTCRLRDANGGVLFLENIVELPARVQARLVRVLRDREVFVEEGRTAQPIDVRPIASVDPSVEAALEEGRLRPDLFERLSLIRVDLPALRQRREDIPVLATHFLKELCKANGKPLKTLTRPALTLLAALPWRGNAPELRGLLERLILLVPQGLIRLEDVLAHTQLEGSISPSGFDATLRQARARFERDYIAAVLQHRHGRIAEAARVLGIQRTNLYRKMRRLNLMRGKAGRDS